LIFLKGGKKRTMKVTDDFLERRIGYLTQCQGDYKIPAGEVSKWLVLLRQNMEVRKFNKQFQKIFMNDPDPEEESRDKILEYSKQAADERDSDKDDLWKR
jgi:hypothetical protein